MRSSQIKIVYLRSRHQTVIILPLIRDTTNMLWIIHTHSFSIEFENNWLRIFREQCLLLRCEFCGCCFYSLASLKTCAWLLIFLTLLSRVFLLFVFSLVLRNSINYIKYLNIIVSISFFNDHELFVLNSNRNRIHVSKLFVHSIFQSIAILNNVSWTWNESENKNQSPRNWNWNNQTTNQNWNWKFYKENCRSTKMCELNRKREFIWSCFFFAIQFNE